MTPQQCRAARAALGWKMQELADKAGLGIWKTLSQFENGHIKAQPKTINRLKTALEAGGITFGKNGCSISWNVPTD